MIQNIYHKYVYINSFNRMFHFLLLYVRVNGIGLVTPSRLETIENNVIERAIFQSSETRLSLLLLELLGLLLLLALSLLFRQRFVELVAEER